MTPEEIALAGDIVRRLGHPPDRAARFADQVGVRDPVPPVGVEIVRLVGLVDDLGALELVGRPVGERHRADGVRASHYRAVRSMLTGAIDDVLGPEFGPAEATAWDRATALVTEILQSP